MTSALRPPAKAQFFTNAGLPASGYKLFTYAATTTTKINTYKDAAQVTANTNPIILNSRGECDLWFSLGLSYKLVLAIPTDTDPPASPVWTVDNITDQSAGALASSTGADNIGFIQAGTGAIARTVRDKLRETVSVADYGTVGDGANDDYTALQNAINTGKDVYLPLGTYFYTTGLTVSTNGQHIFGPGILKPSGAINGITVQGGCVGVELELTFNSATHSSLWCVKVSNADRVNITSLYIFNGFGGVYVERSNVTTIGYMWAQLRGPGIKWYGTNALRSDVLNIEFALFQHAIAGGLDYGLDWDGNCNTLKATYLGMVCGAVESATNARGMIIRNTSGGAPPIIGRFGHLEIDYPGTHGVDITVLSQDLDFSSCYILGAQGSGLRVAATVNSREVRVHGGKFRGCTRYGMENLSVGPMLYSGAADLQDNDLGKLFGEWWTEVQRLTLDDASYFLIDAASNPIWTFDPTDYITYDRTLNTFRAFIGGVEIISWDAAKITAQLPVVMKNYTVATLPAGVVYMRAFVSDSTVTTTAGIGAIVAGGGGNVVPVYYSGANWRIG